MTTKESLINSITLSLIDKTNLSVNQIKSILETELSNYSVIEMKTTLPSTGDGSSTVFLFSEFAKAKASKGMKEKSLYQYKNVVQQICKEERCELNMITESHIIDFLNKQRAKKLSANTVRNKYELLSSVFTYLYNHKFIGENPMNEIDPPKEEIRYKKPLTDLETEYIKIYCEKRKPISSSRALAMINFMLDTGVRVSELTALNISDINFDERTVVVFGKGGKERKIAFTDRTMIRLKEYISLRNDIEVNNGQFICHIDTPLFTRNTAPYNRLTKSAIEAEMRSIGNSSGIIRLHPHLLRATFATNLAKKGVDIQIIASLLGHANLHTIKHYVLLSDSEIRAIVNRVA